LIHVCFSRAGKQENLSGAQKLMKDGISSGFSAILFSGMSLESLHQLPLQLLSLFTEHYLVIQGEKMNADDHDDEKEADPEHYTLNRKEGCPEKPDERDQV
jgi:hypothetical protein